MYKTCNALKGSGGEESSRVLQTNWVHTTYGVNNNNLSALKFAIMMVVWLLVAVWTKCAPNTLLVAYLFFFRPRCGGRFRALCSTWCFQSLTSWFLTGAGTVCWIRELRELEANLAMYSYCVEVQEKMFDPNEMPVVVSGRRSLVTRVARRKRSGAAALIFSMCFFYFVSL